MDAGDTRAKFGLKGLDSKFCQMEQDGREPPTPTLVTSDGQQL